jgi:hypothetical protein
MRNDGSRGGQAMRKTFLCFLFVSVLLPSRSVLAQSAASSQPPEASGGSSEDLAKATQNPVASLISVPVQNNTNFGIGPYDRNQNVLNIQPVIPIQMTQDWNLMSDGLRRSSGSLRRARRIFRR